MAQASGFWDRHAKGYAKKPVADEAAYQKKLRITQDYLKPDMEVLEFGCGTGTTALIHAPYVRHIRAVDISGKMLEIARNKAAAKNITNVTFEQAGIDDLSAADASYDAVMGHSILHLLQDKESVIARVFKMLNPGGIFVSSTVCLGGKMPFFEDRFAGWPVPRAYAPRAVFHRRGAHGKSGGRRLPDRLPMAAGQGSLPVRRGHEALNKVVA